MRILHITASYKPAYIYGGPIYSVAALCEGLVEGDFDSSLVFAQDGIAQDDIVNDEIDQDDLAKDNPPYFRGNSSINFNVILYLIYKKHIKPQDDVAQPDY